MTLKAIMSACALTTLAACGWIAEARQSTPPPPSSGSGSSSSAPSLLDPNFPILWSVTGTRSPDVNFAGLPIQRGRIHIFYECCFGKYPRIWVDPQGRQHHINGSIPQRTDWNGHFAKLREDVAAMIPDPNWDGYAIIDYEAWDLKWVLLRDENIKRESRNHVRSRFPGLSDQEVEARAAQEFEEAAFDFFIRTIRAAKAERPRAKWGLYGNPWPHHQQRFPQEYQRLYDEVDAFFPNVYCVNYGVEEGVQPGPGQRAGSHYAQVIRDKMALARSVAVEKPIIVLMWIRYHEMNTRYGHQMLNDRDIRTMMLETRRAPVNGAAFWDNIREPELLNQYNQFFSGRGGTILRDVLVQFAPPPPPPPPPAPNTSTGSPGSSGASSSTGAIQKQSTTNDTVNPKTQVRPAAVTTFRSAKNRPSFGGSNNSNSQSSPRPPAGPPPASPSNSAPSR